MVKCIRGCYLNCECDSKEKQTSQTRSTKNKFRNLTATKCHAHFRLHIFQQKKDENIYKTWLHFWKSWGIYSLRCINSSFTNELKLFLILISTQRNKMLFKTKYGLMFPKWMEWNGKLCLALCIIWTFHLLWLSTRIYYYHNHGVRQKALNDLPFYVIW